MNRRNSVILALAALLALAGCKAGRHTKRNPYLRMEPREQVRFAERTGHPNLQHPTFIELDDTLFIIGSKGDFPNKKNYGLYLYNTETKGPVDSILFPRVVGPERFPWEPYHLLSRDSMIKTWPSAYFRPPYYYNDSMMAVYDRSADHLQFYDCCLDGMLPCEQGPKVPKEDLYQIRIRDNKLPRIGNRLFLPLDKTYFRPGPGFTPEDRGPVGIEVALLPDGKANLKPHPVYMPAYGAAHHFPSSHRLPRREVNGRGNVVYAFAMTPVYKEYNPQTEEVREFRAPSVLLDTVKPIPVNPDGTAAYRVQFDPNQGQFFDFKYDKWRDRYYRALILSPDSNAGPAERNLRRYGLMVLDADFNVLGECVLPEEHQATAKQRWLNIAPAPEGVYFFNIQKTADLGEAVYTLYDFHFEEKWPRQKKRKAKGPKQDDWPGYLKKAHDIKEVNALALVLPLQTACPACRNAMLDYYRTFRERNPETPLHLVVMAAHQEIIDKELGKIGLDPETDPYLHVDSENKYLSYVLTFVNPHLIEIEEGEVKRNRQINPADVPDVPDWVDACLKENGEQRSGE